MEWFDSVSLVERVNFAAKEVSNLDNPGVRAIIDRLASEDGGELTPEQLVNKCVDLLGPIVVSDTTRSALIEFASRGGNVDLTGHEPGGKSEQRVANVLRLVASTKEYQLA